MLCVRQLPLLVSGEPDNQPLGNTKIVNSAECIWEAGDMFQISGFIICSGAKTECYFVLNTVEEIQVSQRSSKAISSQAVMPHYFELEETNYLTVKVFFFSPLCLSNQPLWYERKQGRHGDLDNCINSLQRMSSPCFSEYTSL